MLRRWLGCGGIVAAFLLLFVCVHLVHVWYLPVRVVLYDALLDAAVSFVLFALLLAALRRLRFGASGTEAGLAAVIGFLLAVNFAFAGPAIVDRSLSMYFLEKLAQRGGAIRQDAWLDIITREYMHEYQVVDVRLTEQLNSGTITVKDGCVRLTPRGERMARITSFYRAYLLPRQREILGRFTDDLTDPLRATPATVPYACDPPKGG